MGRLSYNVNFWFNYLAKTFDANLPNSEQIELSAKEVNYYCKINNPFILNSGFQVKDINLLKSSGYSYDLYRILYPFRNTIRFNYIFGDVIEIPSIPSFVKSRPISDYNENSVLLPLDSNRHFNFIDDQTKFVEKKDEAVWRGAAYQKHRIDFLESCMDLPFINLGNTAKIDGETTICESPKMPIKEQLKYKFIISLEGNDVATNLKWIMSSNSVCIMPRPKYETWFMEGKLKPGIHYIEIQDDYSDLEEQFRKYVNKPEWCEQIIFNANEYTKKFKSISNRLLKARMVCKKFINLTSV